MILLALGGNQGDRRANLAAALRALEAAEVRVLAVSPLYETAALLPENAPPEWDISYYNLVCRVETALEPHDLLALAKNVETVLGRVDNGYWGPRPIDIDILAYDDRVLESERLTLPHRHMLRRDFVLLPLRDIAPGWRHPEAGITVVEAVRGEGMQTGAGITCLDAPFNWREG